MIALCPNSHGVKTREQLREVLFIMAKQRHDALVGQR
jgi:hypothetical protein